MAGCYSLTFLLRNMEPLNKPNSSNTQAPCFDVNLCISNGTVSPQNDKWDNFDFDIVNFPFLDGDVPRRISYWVYISQLIRFSRASSNLSVFNCRNKALTAKRRHNALAKKYNISLKTFLLQGISEPEFYCDLVYRFRKIVGKSKQFRKLING